MKRLVSLILVLAFVFCGCGASKSASEITQELPEIEALSEKEKLLFDAIIKLSKDLYSPTTARVLEVYNYQERAQYDADSDKFGPDTVIVKLQMDSSSGGTGSIDIIICLVGAENTSQEGKKQLAEIDKLLEMGKYAGASGDDINLLKSQRLEYSGSFGDYSIFCDIGLKLYHQYGDEGVLLPHRDASEIFNIRTVNKAIKAYWEDMGF